MKAERRIVYRVRIPGEAYTVDTYHAKTRSNYFSVKDAQEFQAWASRRKLKVWTKYEMFAFTADVDGDSHGWQIFDAVTREYYNLVVELSQHLVEGEVAVLVEVGSEELDYLGAYAVAVNASGDITSINIDDIYKEAAAKFGVPSDRISRAEL